MSTVLLARLAPMVERGVIHLLADHECVHGRRRLTAQARRMRPSAVVIGLGQPRARDLAARVRAAAPEAKVILWPPAGDRMEVFSGTAPARLRPARADALLDELRDD